MGMVTQAMEVKSMKNQFVHLHVHTEYSLIDGLVTIPTLMGGVVDKGMRAVAVTDRANLFAAVKVFQAAISMGVKPILGVSLWCRSRKHPQVLDDLVLLCQNMVGYRNVTTLVSRAYQEGQYAGKACIWEDWLPMYSEGVILLSGGRTGIIGRLSLEGDLAGALQIARDMHDAFPDRFYLEIQRTGHPEDEKYNRIALDIARQLDVPVVATNNVRFIAQEDFDAHEARVCIHDGYMLEDTKRPKVYSAMQYLRSAQEMVELFSDIPEAVQNTVKISERCTVMLQLGTPYLPNFPTPHGESVEEYLRVLAQEGLRLRLPDRSDTSIYQDRLALELDVIVSMGFAGYFLIVADFIRWAKQTGIPVGPGRGSGAGSLVAYVLDITDLDPLLYDLLFERFLNPERVSMPDFDIDFCTEGRDRVIEYVMDKYGRESVSQIITFGTMAAKAVIRDVGRVLGHPYGFVDTLAKLIPFELGMTLDKALHDEPALKKRYQEEEEVKELFDLAMKLEGISRNAGKHAGGIVIAPSKLTDFTAVYCEPGSDQLVSQFDKDDVEAVGLVKFDFLGLRTLTVIRKAITIINDRRQAQHESPLDIADIPMDDPATLDFFKTSSTDGIFQLESRGMKDLIRRLQPDCFEDIIALVALFRPGPLQSGMVDDFVDRKHGISPVVYPHPDVEPILRPTYGVILYQEQVMQIAQVLAQYTLGAADILRRAMGKKKPEEMAEQRTIFLEGATARGVDTEVATSIFDLMEKFAGYGFNKSHSAAYALITYQTAWLKTHYPAAFMAAVLSCDLDNTDKVVLFLADCRHMGLTVRPPSIQYSAYGFVVEDDKTLLYGLGAIKGVGENACLSIVAERQAHGPYTSLFDLCARVDMRKVNKRVLEALIKAGAMDCFGVGRSTLMASIEKATGFAESQRTDTMYGQMQLFEAASTTQVEYVSMKSWTEQETLISEKEVLGFYMSGHPTTPYLEEFTSFVAPLASCGSGGRRKVVLCGLVLSVRSIITQKGKKLYILSIEDGSSASGDILFFSETYEAIAPSPKNGDIVVVEAEVSQREGDTGLRFLGNALAPIDEARSRYIKAFKIKLNKEDGQYREALQALFRQYPGNTAVIIEYRHPEAGVVNLNPDAKWRVALEDGFLSALRALLGAEKVVVEYQSMMHYA